MRIENEQAILKLLIVFVFGVLYHTVVASVGRQKRQAILGSSFPQNRWDPDEPIPYSLDALLSSNARLVIRTAIDFWQNHSCAKFREEEAGKSRPQVHFFKGTGCSSQIIGKDTNGSTFQNVSIGAACSFFGPVAHEIGHVLGLIHTHVRSDRDAFITLDAQNAPNGTTNGFGKESADSSINLGVDYDFGSVMHYTGYNQQNRKVIMQAKWPKYQHTMGNTYGPVFSDLVAVNRYFGCGRICLTVQSAKCQNGGFPNPNRCSECICPNGFGSADCSTRASAEGSASANCGATLQTSAEWQTLNGSVDADPKGQLRQAGCHFHIWAPEGSSVEMRVDSLSGLCSPECVVGAVEIKFERLQSAGARMCCKAQIAELGAFTSVGRLAIVSVYSQKDRRTFSLRYRTTNAVVVSTPPFPSPPSFSADDERRFFHSRARPVHKCLDMSPNCVQHSTVCRTPEFADNMAKLCAHTCGLCCEDAATHCSRISYLCSSGSRRAPMLAMCAKTCGGCTDGRID